MSALGYKVGTLTILSGQTKSQALSAGRSHGVMKTLLGPGIDMVIFAPPATSGTITVQVSAEKDALDAQFFNLTDGHGSDITISANKASPLPSQAYKDLRLVSSSAEAADRVFTLYQQEWTT